MQIKVQDNKSPDVILLPLLQDDQLLHHLDGIATRVGIDAGALQHEFKAKPKELMTLFAYNNPGKKIYLLGLGDKLELQTFRMILRSFCMEHKDKFPQRLGLDIRHFDEADYPLIIEGGVFGMTLGLYAPEGQSLRKIKSEFEQSRSQLILLVHNGIKKELTPLIERAIVIAQATAHIINLVNLPGNKKSPQLLRAQIERDAEQYGFKSRSYDKESLDKMGLNALLAVGKGSPHPPELLWLEYGSKTKSKEQPFIGLVGKGVTFDTGGISIKPSDNMQFMKSDMGGAAAVIGVFMVAAALKLPVRLVGAIPIAENMPDGNAIKPGDVIESHSGQTVEITDTDAEGRLLLADALSYLTSRETPDALIDVATLTGSVIRAIGTQAGGLFTPSQSLGRELVQAGQAVGERLWPFPMWQEYAKDLKSDVADLKNYSGKPLAECIVAAKFLERFTGNHPSWAHLDIAGMAFGDTEFTHNKSASGYGLRLLLEFIERRIYIQEKTENLSKGE
jgi:leucyl aminopeptidase